MFKKRMYLLKAMSYKLILLIKRRLIIKYIFVRLGDLIELALFY